MPVSTHVEGKHIEERLADHVEDTLKRSRLLFGGSSGGGAAPIAMPSDCSEAKKTAVEARLATPGYRRVRDMPAIRMPSKKAKRGAGDKSAPSPDLAMAPLGPGVSEKHASGKPTAKPSPASSSSNELAIINPIGGGTKAHVSNAAKRARQQTNGSVTFDTPQWHPPWKLMRVISGHLGWVRSIAFSPENEWFVTGSADRTIKVWDVASGELKLTLTGHINTVRGLVVSDRHPYLFSCGEDRTVKCWDLNTNQVIRSYHGHLSGVYSLAMHPKLDVLVSGGRDSCARLWDMRTKREIHVLGGHEDAVGSVLCQPTDPQIITGSYDKTIRLWDIVAGRSITTLTNHKRGVRALVSHPTEFSFASAAADNIKKWQLPAGRFMQNLNLVGNTASRGHNLDIVNALAVNDDDVLVSGGDDGMIDFWDWRSGHCFQSIKTEVQPGSLDSEAAIYATCFDRTGSRLFTCEADKTIKVWKEDETATEETHPIKGWDPKARRRARRH